LLALQFYSHSPFNKLQQPAHCEPHEEFPCSMTGLISITDPLRTSQYPSASA
jgi:hypothetical protein